MRTTTRATRATSALCSGKTDDKGRMACDATLEQAGNVQLIAVAKDGDGRPSNASTSVWVTRDELWFGGDNTDRIDVIPEKPRTNRAKPPASRYACRSATPPRWSRSNAAA